MTVATANVQLKIDFQTLFNGVSQLDTPTLENLAHQIHVLVAQRKTPGLSERETELILKINEGLPVALQKRYGALLVKLEDETLTDAEHEDLLSLTPKVMQYEAERLKHLVELATIRKTTVEALMKQMGLKPKSYA